MAGDPFQPVFPGQKLEIPAPAYNAFLDAARAQRDRLVDSGRDPRVDSRQSGIIKIRNDSGSDRGRFDVLGIAGPMIYPSEDLDEFQSRVAFAGVTPRDVHRGRFVVLMEPLEDGAIGRAVVAGIAPVRLQNSPDQPPTSLAEMIPDSTLALRVDPHGSAQILWREESTSSLTWAVVRLLGPPASGMVYVLDPCASGDGEAILVGNDLGAWLGRVVKVNGICYYVRRPQPGEFDCGIPSCVSVEAHYADCKRCNGCWELTPCASGTIIQSQTDLAAYEDMIVRLADGNCYTVGLAEECIDPVPVSVVASYSICEACHSCYHLVNCHDPGDTRAIGNDLARLQGIEPAEVLGTVVEIDGACYQVLTYDDSCGDAEIVAIQAAHEDCEACGCFQLTACAGAPPTVIHVRDATGPGGSLALSDYVGQIVRLSDGVCYQVQPSSECEDLVSVEVIEAYADCESCACWELTACVRSGGVLPRMRGLPRYGALSAHARLPDRRLRNGRRRRER
ncbi:MAG: hypothetical protein K8T89_15345 [Planctomycetes bacterium]|nr:hypothetical protein [Planctomycetota bacterium]